MIYFSNKSVITNAGKVNAGDTSKVILSDIDEEKTNELGSEADEEDESDSKDALDKMFKPSSFGFTCRLSPETKKIQATIQYGQYQAVKDKETGICMETYDNGFFSSSLN